MSARRRGTILLATLNEDESIRPVLEEVVESILSLKRFGYELSILVVDDGIDSRLQDIVERCGTQWGVSVHYVRGPGQGLGAALTYGLDYAVTGLNCDYVVNLDADGQHDARQIPDLLRAHMTSHSAITIGSRWARGGKCYGLSTPRKIVSRLSSLALRMTSIPWHVKDPTTSFRIYSRESVVRCVRETIGFSGFSFFGCIIAVANAQALPVNEIPIHFRPRFAGKSNLHFRQMWRAMRDLPAIRARAGMVSRRHRSGIEDGLHDAYPAGDLLEHLSSTRRTALRWYHEFKFALGTNVLEVGSGSGHNTAIISEHAQSVVALEPDRLLYEKSLAECRSLPNVAVFNTSLRAYLGSQDHRHDFTSVVYVNVLEHISDDLSELQAAWTALQRGGHLVVFSPARPSYYGTLDGLSLHYRRYSRREAEMLLRAAGFEPIIVHEHDPLGGIIYLLLYRVLKLKSAGRASVFTYDNIVLPVSEFFARLTKHRLSGKNLLMVGRKI